MLKRRVGCYRQWISFALTTSALALALNMGGVVPSETPNRECENTDCSVKQTPPAKRCGLEGGLPNTPDRQCGW